MYRSITYWAGLCALLANLTHVIARPAGFNGATILKRQEQLNDEYDYVIVGAGTAGLTVADRLTADGQRKA